MRHLEIDVANTAELLAAEAYGAGALLRWERSAAEAGPYAEGGTAALVPGTELYDVWDAAGVETTWYRTRVSDAAGTTFSAYSAPRSPVTSLVSPAEVRALVQSRLSDADLQAVIDREEAALARLVGPLAGERTQTWFVGDASGPWPVYGFDPPGGFDAVHRGARVASDRMAPLMLLRPADSAGVVDGSTAVDPQDVRLIRNGTQLERASGGWNGPVVAATYTPNDRAEVVRVVIALCRLTLGDTGYASETIGDYSYARSESVTDLRRALARSLGTAPRRGTVAVRTSSDTARVGTVAAP
jgi:hypothetical protein